MENTKKHTTQNENNERATQERSMNQGRETQERSMGQEKHGRTMEEGHSASKGHAAPHSETSKRTSEYQEARPGKGGKL
jgi:hypothetical protein